MSSHTKTIYEALNRETVHPFPARMAPGIALDYLSDKKENMRVLDPMMGSGTVVAVARQYGHQSIGVDIDPLSILIGRVWTKAIDPEAVRKKAVEVLIRAKRIFKTLKIGDAYPIGVDHETRQFIRYWFDDYTRRQLTSLARVISRVREKDIRDVLWCAFSRLIITKQAGASLAKDLAHSRPHKFYKRAPIKPFRKFLAAVDRVTNNCISNKTKNRGPASIIYQGDARNIPVEDDSIDLVLTSPPYLNAIDYLRCSKFSLIWMDHDIATIQSTRRNCIGAEVGDYSNSTDKFVAEIFSQLQLRPKLSRRHAAILRRYIVDIQKMIQEVSRVLVPKGKAVFVVGDNTIRGTFVRNSKIVSLIAESEGLKLQSRRSRQLPANRRYLPPPVSSRSSLALDTRMRREVILAYRQPANG